MTRGARSALGADALRGLLGAEDLGPAAPATAAQPPKPRKARPPRRRPASPRPAPAARPAPESPRAAGAGAAAGEVEGPAEQALASAPAPRPRRTNVQGYIDAQVLDRARDAAFWTPGVSLSALIEQGLRSEIARLEAERGGRFPRRRGPLTPGPAVR